MQTIKKAQAGSFESSDILILVSPVEKGKGRIIEIDSGVFPQYGDKILEIFNNVLDQYKIDDIQIKANDKGAIDAVITARLETVLERCLGKQEGTLY